MRATSALSLLALLGASTLPAAAFDINDARHTVSVSEAQISPDGTRVVYVRGKADFDKDRTDRQLMLIDVRTHRQRQLTFERKGIGSPLWMPGGTGIAFLAEDGDEKNPEQQVFIMPMDGGDARQVTHAKNGVTNYVLSHDGSKIAYAMQDENPNQKEIDAHRDAFEVHDNDYLRRSATMPVHAWWISSQGGTAHRLTSGSWSIANVDPDGGGDLSWSPNGRAIAFERYPTPFNGDSLGSQVNIVDIASDRIHVLDGKLTEGNPVFAPSGDRIAYVRNTGGDPTKGSDAYVVDAGGKTLVDFRRDVDRNVQESAWNAGGTALFVLTTDGPNTSIWYHPLSGHELKINLGELEPLTLGNVA